MLLCSNSHILVYRFEARPSGVDFFVSGKNALNGPIVSSNSQSDIYLITADRDALPPSTFSRPSVVSDILCRRQWFGLASPPLSTPELETRVYLWPECSRALVGFCAEARGTVPLKNVITQCSCYDPSRGFFETDEHLTSKHLNLVVFEPLAPRIIPTPNLQVFFFLCALPIVILFEKKPEKGSSDVFFPIFSIKKEAKSNPKETPKFQKSAAFDGIGGR